MAVPAASSMVSTTNFDRGQSSDRGVQPFGEVGATFDGDSAFNKGTPVFDRGSTGFYMGCYNAGHSSSDSGQKGHGFTQGTNSSGKGYPNFDLGRHNLGHSTSDVARRSIMTGGTSFERGGTSFDPPSSDEDNMTSISQRKTTSSKHGIKSSTGKDDIHRYSGRDDVSTYSKHKATTMRGGEKNDRKTIDEAIDREVKTRLSIFERGLAVGVNAARGITPLARRDYGDYCRYGRKCKYFLKMPSACDKKHRQEDVAWKLEQSSDTLAALEYAAESNSKRASSSTR